MPFPYELTPPAEESPEIRMLLNGQEYLLRHDNTTIKHFKEGEGAFDLALHVPDGVSTLPIFFDQPGGDELKAQLIAAEFYSSTLDKLDQETIDLLDRYLRIPETWLQ